VVLAAVQQDGHALRYVDAALKSDREVVLAAVQQTWRALMYASLENVRDEDFKNKIKDAAKKQWPEDEEDADDGGELVCRFVRPSGEVIEDADAWDKTTGELAELLMRRCIISRNQSVKFVDRGKQTRPLSFLAVPYPKEVCDVLSRHTLTEPTNKRSMPSITMVVVSNISGR
jgi:hypothetical protein